MSVTIAANPPGHQSKASFQSIIPEHHFQGIRASLSEASVERPALGPPGRPPERALRLAQRAQLELLPQLAHQRVAGCVDSAVPVEPSALAQPLEPPMADPPVVRRVALPLAALRLEPKSGQLEPLRSPVCCSSTRGCSGSLEPRALGCREYPPYFVTSFPFQDGTVGGSAALRSPQLAHPTGLEPASSSPQSWRSSTTQFLPLPSEVPSSQ